MKSARSNTIATTSGDQSDIISSDEGRSSPDSSEMMDEKMAVAEKIGADLDHTVGRPDFGKLLGEVIRDAKGGAVAVNGEHSPLSFSLEARETDPTSSSLRPSLRPLLPLLLRPIGAQLEGRTLQG